ncbi:hypothetical protein N8878_01910 [Psychromonas sp.]|nr:hypothetical protein [Psychromonas sp.]
MFNKQTLHSPKLLFIDSIFQRTILFFTIIALSACSFSREPIDDIKVIQQGQSSSTRISMKDVCKGFVVDEQKLKDFLTYSSVAENQESNTHYQLLPCFSSGTVYLENQQYQWILRAGGVGEFYNDNDRFTKICGIKCCNKVQGVC